MKVKYLQISPERIIDLLKGNIKPFTINPTLPTDMRIIDIIREPTFDEGHNIFWLLLESEEFPEVPEAGIIPLLPTITCTTKEETK